jgi:hypothetical protein
MGKLFQQFPEKTEVPAALPGLVTASDVREVVRFLRRIPEGIPLMEVNEAFRKRILDSRKRSAYELWGLMVETAGRVSLADLGWEFAARLGPETEVYRQILRRMQPYQSALEWIDQSEFELVTWEEVDKFWSDSHSESLDRNLREAQALTFFDLCHAAEIGRNTVGRKGHPARLRVYRDELSSHLINKRAQSIRTAASVDSETVPDPVTVFVSQTRDVVLSATLRKALELGGFQSTFVEREPTRLIPISEPALAAMKLCNSGLVVITQGDCAEGSDNVNLSEHLIGEIVAAFVYFDRRLVLLAQNGVRLPQSFQNLHCCEFDGILPSSQVLNRVIERLKSLTAGVID